MISGLRWDISGLFGALGWYFLVRWVIFLHTSPSFSFLGLYMFVCLALHLYHKRANWGTILRVGIMDMYYAIS